MSFGYEPGKTVLRDVNLSICENEVACIVGPNGGGKSTLLYLMLGILSPDSGSIRIFGKNPVKAREYIGYMPQYFSLDRNFPISVLEVTLMGRIRQNSWWRYSKSDREAAMDALAQMSMENHAKRSFADLSGGQRQRVLIARALASRPRVLLLDEPTANVDPGFQEQFYAILEKLHNSMAIVIVSHDLGFVSRQIDNVICVNQDVHIHPTDKLNGNIIQAVYGYDVNVIRHDKCTAKGHTHGRLI